MKILAIDCETSPNLAHVWGLFKQNVGINQLVATTEMLCFGAQWIEIKDGKVHRGEYVFAAQWETGGRKGMVRKLWKLLDEADAVMGWNNSTFDNKHFTREFFEMGLPPHRPYLSIDLMFKVKSLVRLPSYKLDFVLQWLNIGKKVETGGFSLWSGVMKGEKWAQDKMEEYQRGDVEDVLVAVLERILPWIDLPANVNLYTDGYDVDSRPLCKNCGGKTKWDGWRMTASSRFRQYKCKSCGKYGRHRLRAAGASAH